MVGGVDLKDLGTFRFRGDVKRRDSSCIVEEGSDDLADLVYAIIHRDVFGCGA